MFESVHIVTEDGVRIAADWHLAPGEKFAILLHMRPATKESWGAWIAPLMEAGYSCLAYDQRGHGGSTMDGTLKFEAFTDAQNQAKQKDLEAVFAWLQGKGATEANTVLIGASMGANLAIRFMAEHHGVPITLALSPGINYRGIATDDAITQLGPIQRVVLVASDDDVEAFEGCRRLNTLAPDRTTFVEKHSLGHGTHMTEREPALIDALINRLP